jgi:RecB family exonuclease
VRVPDVDQFRHVLRALACEGTPLDAGDRLILVPTHAAAAHLGRSIPALSFATRDEMYARFAERLSHSPAMLTGAGREALLGAACRDAVEAGTEPPFRPRPGLIAEILRFFDTLHRHETDVDAFERLALGMLEPGADTDRGAERLVRQTRFLLAAFTRFRERCDATGLLDEHGLRHQLLGMPPVRPWRHAIVAVGDRAFDSHGLFRTDWDFLARVPGLERLDVVATEEQIAGAFHERLLDLLPGIEEARVEAADERRRPVLLVPPAPHVALAARDREEEVAGFARWVTHLHHEGHLRSLDRAALVVHRPLPYVYLAREVLRSAAVPCQMFDTLPLAAEPFAAALDLVFSCVASNFARTPSIALLRSPHFSFAGRLKPAPPTALPPSFPARVEPAPATALQLPFPGWDEPAPATIAAELTAAHVASLDRALSEAGYLGGVDALDRIDAAGADILKHTAASLVPLREPRPFAEHVDIVLAFIAARERLPAADDPLRERHLRARAAILEILTALRDAYRRFDAAAVDFDHVAATVRRWIDAHTFAPHSGGSGVHIVDTASARFGDFDAVQLAGLVDGEWPDRPRRDIFYSPAILRQLGWPSESHRLAGMRAAFRDLLRLADRVVVSTFTLEDDALVTVSPLLDEIDAGDLERAEYETSRVPIFDYERMAAQAAGTGEDARYRGVTSGHRPARYSLSALERYQDCPFRFFATDVLRLDEPLEDEPLLSPRARGRFVHEVFQRFFEEWDRRQGGTITPERIDEARALFEQVAASLLARFPDSDAALERTRLFGSAISVGIVDVVLGLEAGRPVDVRSRWLEHRFDGEYSLGGSDRRLALKGVIDRVDLLDGHRLRVIDYKSGYAPNVKRALQVPVYALAAREQLSQGEGPAWQIDEAAYVAFTGKRNLVPVVKPAAGDAAETLAAARERMFAAVDAIERGEFPPRPHDPIMCTSCAYPSVCRKDYVGD